jgi:hypothetical protein
VIGRASIGTSPRRRAGRSSAFASVGVDAGECLEPRSRARLVLPECLVPPDLRADPRELAACELRGRGTMFLVRRDRRSVRIDPVDAARSQASPGRRGLEAVRP